MKVTLPYPPTGNLYWRHARGRTFLSAAAKAFKAEVRKRLAAAKVTPQEGPLALHVHVYRPRKVGDLDNTLKVLGDALNGAAWHDDKQVVEIHAYRHDDKGNPRAEVEVLRVGEEPFTVADARAALSHPPGCRCKPCARVDAAIAEEKAARATPPVQGPGVRETFGRKARSASPYYIPPRSTPVDSAKEAEATFAPADDGHRPCARPECTKRVIGSDTCMEHDP